MTALFLMWDESVPGLDSRNAQRIGADLMHVSVKHRGGGSTVMSALSP
jgi:hypothetical protein